MNVRKISSEDLVVLKTDEFFNCKFIENGIYLKNICENYFCFGIYKNDKILGIALFNKSKVLDLNLKALFIKEQTDSNKLTWNLLKHAEAYLTQQNKMVVY